MLCPRQIPDNQGFGIACRYAPGEASSEGCRGDLAPRSLGMLMRPNIGPQMASEEELASRREVWSMNTGGQGPAGAPKTQQLYNIIYQ